MMMLTTMLFLMSMHDPGDYLWGVVVSARATVKAIERAVPDFKQRREIK